MNIRANALLSKCLTGLLAVSLLAFSGVSGTPEARAAAKQITFLGGSVGGLWGIISEGVSESIRRSFPNYRVTTEPGKDGPNQVMVSRGQVEFALASDTITLYALDGKGPFKNKLGNLRLVSVMNPTSAVQFFIKARTGIKSFEDIKERKYPLRICVNRQGTVMEALSQKVLESYGISFEDIEKWGGKVHKIPGPEAVSMWDAGQMDCIVEVSQFPLSRFYELGQKSDILLLPVGEKQRELINAEMGTTSIKIPANSYFFQPEDVYTVNSQLVVITSAEQPDENVADILTAITKNLDYLHKVHANLRGLNPEIMQDNARIPLHPAARKFYEELK